MQVDPGGWLGATICLVAIFLPSFFLVIGAMPFWEELRRGATARAALAGVNAAVVGLLLAAFYRPVWVTGIGGVGDFALAIMAFLLLFMWRRPPWLVVVLSAVAGAAIAAW
jgi:chromate transporter